MTKEERNAKLQEIVIKDGEFADRMKDTIEPWVKEHLQEAYFTNKDGMRLHVCYAINPNETAAITISHGFCEFASKFYEVMYYMYQMGYSPFFIEHRGYGKSEREKGIDEIDKVHVKDYSDYVLDYKQFVDEIVMPNRKSEHLYLFAHSMGGCIAALLLEQYPDLFEKAVLSCPMMSVKYGSIPKWQVELMLAAVAILPIKKKYAPGQHGFDGINRFPECSSLSEERFTYIFQERLDHEENTCNGGTFGWVRASEYATRRAVRDAGLIKAPVLMFQAGRDHMVPPEGQNEFVKNAKTARKIFVAESKHEFFTATYDIMLPYYEEVFDFYALA